MTEEEKKIFDTKNYASQKITSDFKGKIFSNEYRYSSDRPCFMPCHNNLEFEGPTISLEITRDKLFCADENGDIFKTNNPLTKHKTEFDFDF